MPTVSVILPTYNRADTILRAVASVQAQSFTDWELIVVDDGSTDNTRSILAGVDPRVRVIAQANGGCYVARNTGLRESRGRFITFIDSDDEWLPHFLELTTAFLESSPHDHFVMTEFLTVTGRGTFVRNDRDLFAHRWPEFARAVGSHALDLPAGETDDYLRVYREREPIGAWGRDIAARAGYPQARLYRGQIFDYFRWGHIGWLPITMVTRHALEVVGPFLENYRTAADWRFLALLSRTFRANLIAVPCAIKHDTAIGGQALSEGHLAAGAHEYRYAEQRLRLFDELFREESRLDPETRRIRGLYQLYAGCTALELGKRGAALVHLREACGANPRLWRAQLLRAMAAMVPSDALAGRIYRLGLRLYYLAQAVVQRRGVAAPG